MPSSTTIEFPCLSMDISAWVSGSSTPMESSMTSSTSSIEEDVLDALQRFLINPSEPKITNDNDKWLYKKSAKSTKPLMEPVLKPTSQSFWLAEEPEQPRAPVAERVPDPSTSLWLAASTGSISYQSEQAKILWPKTQDGLDNWLSNAGFKPNFDSVNESIKSSKSMPNMDQWILGQSEVAEVADKPAKAISDLDDWLMKAKMDELVIDSADQSGSVEHWLELASQEEDLEDEEDHGSSIVIIDEEGDDDMFEEVEFDNSLSAWLI